VGADAKLSYSPVWQKLCQLTEFQSGLDGKKRDGTISPVMMVRKTESRLESISHV
jgi:hypothetical protein